MTLFCCRRAVGHHRFRDIRKDFAHRSEVISCHPSDSVVIYGPTVCECHAFSPPATWSFYGVQLDHDLDILDCWIFEHSAPSLEVSWRNGSVRSRYMKKVASSLSNVFYSQYSSKSLPRVEGATPPNLPITL